MKSWFGKHKGWLWGIAWLLLLGLGLDYYNWGEQPQFFFGMPLWLWRLIGLVLLIALVYFILSRVAWEEE